uniref:ATP-dependent RNA helicase n=1 Tax=Palpitomonas bilix TaxID=652834 RepID=A0A7S3GEV4_9EUKA|mmetsp:Transcript_46497/g.119987  ORF Transcript_46497/g.119987 Transcript_46497/m.119987 type:complete len:526 (+) Transcript_46497:63-1640(+)
MEEEGGDFQLFSRPSAARTSTSSSASVGNPSSLSPPSAKKRLKKKKGATKRKQVEKEVIAEKSDHSDGDESDEAADSFEELGLAPWIIDALKEIELTKPTLVQSKCIPPTLEGRSVLASSPTGSGKTLSFALPILSHLSKDPFGIFALVLTPSRELAIQINEQFEAVGAAMNLRHEVVIGGVDIVKQAMKLAARPHVVVATPGRLCDFIKESIGNERELFSRVKYLVLDEADRLLEPGFAAELGPIVEALPEKRITLAYSATITPQLEKMKEMGKNPPFYFNSTPMLYTTPKSLREEMIVCPAKVKDLYLVHTLVSEADDLIESEDKMNGGLIIFTSKCFTAALLCLMLRKLEFNTVVLHSYLSQRDRIINLNKFRGKKADILVATDVASRGLDIPTVRLVVNYDMPRWPKDYVHRVGRTARAGRDGRAISLVTQYDVELVKEVEAITEKKLQELEVEEKMVLTLFNKITKAKQASKIELIDSGLDEKIAERKKRYGKNREGNAENRTDESSAKGKKRRKKHAAH